MPRKKKIMIIWGAIALIIVILAALWILHIRSAETEYNALKTDELSEYNLRKITDTFISSEQRSAIYLANQTVKVKQGESFGIAFAIRNLGKEGIFAYELKNVNTNCTKEDPISWIPYPNSSEFTVLENAISFQILKIEPPKTAEICHAKFIIEIKKDGAVYDTPSFIVETVKSRWF